MPLDPELAKLVEATNASVSTAPTGALADLVRLTNGPSAVTPLPSASAQRFRVEPQPIQKTKAYLSALRETVRNEATLRAIGQGKAVETALEETEPGTFQTLTGPIFDLLQIGQFTAAGAALEVQKSGFGWEMFKRAASEAVNALPGFDEDYAESLTGVRPTRASFSDVLKKSGVKMFDPEQGGKWYAAGGGLVLDIVLDPLTYAGGVGLLKKVPGVVRGVEATKKAVGATAVGGALGRKFIPDFAIKQAVREGHITEGAAARWVAAREVRETATELGLVDMRDAVTELAAGMTTGERRLMGALLDQPDKLRDQLRLVASGPEHLRELEGKFAAFQKHFADILTDEKSAGIFSPTMMRAHYAPARFPVTGTSKRAMKTLFDKLGVEETRRILPGQTGGAGGLKTIPGFSKAKSFQTLEERIAAGVPTEVDIALMSAKRGVESVRAQATRRFIDGVLSDPNVARRVEDLSQFMSGGKLTDEFEAGLKATGYGVWKPPAAVGKEREAYILPQVFIDDLEYMNRVFTGASEARQLFNTFKALQNTWKGYAVLSPGFHLRNTWSNWFNNSLGGLRTPGAYVTAGTLQAGKGLNRKIGKYTGAEVLAMARERGVLQAGLMGRDIPLDVERELFTALTARSGRDLAGKLTDPLAKAAVESAAGPSVRELFSRVGGQGSPHLKANRAVGAAFENNARLAQFIHQLQKGKGADEAALQVKKYLFDYGDLTPFEREVMKSVVPFYSWIRKNLPLQLQSILEKPGLYAAMTGKWIQAVEDLSKDMEGIPTPDYFQEIHAVRLPIEASRALNRAKNAVNRTIGRPEAEDVQPLFLNPNLPFQNLNNLNWKDLFASLTPAAKLVIEQAGGGDRGWSLFMDRPLERFPGETSEVATLPNVDVPFLGNLRRKRIEDVVRALVPPVGKVQRLRERAQRGQLAEQLATEVGGVKLIGVDVERVRKTKTYEKREALRNLRDRLREKGMIF